MSPKSKQQNELIKVGRKHEISATALKLFAENGFQHTTISAIAKEAGIAKGLLYNYYDSKEALIKEIIISELHQFTNLFDSNNDGILTAEEFEFFIKNTIATLKKNPEHWKLYFAAFLQKDVLQILRHELEAKLMPQYLILIDYYRRKGETNPEAAALLLTATLDGISLNYIHAPDAYPLEALGELILQKFK